MAQPAEHASPQAGGGRPVFAGTQGGASGITDSDTDHGAVPVLARIALRHASSRAAHKGYYTVIDVFQLSRHPGS